MSMQGRYIEDDRLSALAEQSARLCRKAGPVPAKATVSKLRAAMSEIDAAYEKVAERFGTAASVPDACRWLLDNRYIAVREAKCASSALLREKSLRGSEAGVILLDMCRTLVDAGLGKVTEERCRLFLDGYQTVSVLPRKELYLFPAALRMALIERLAGLCRELLSTNTPETLTDGFAAVFTSLRLVSGLDMQCLLESVDVSEKLLREFIPRWMTSAVRITVSGCPALPRQTPWRSITLQSILSSCARSPMARPAMWGTTCLQSPWARTKKPPAVRCI